MSYYIHMYLNMKTGELFKAEPKLELTGRAGPAQQSRTTVTTLIDRIDGVPKVSSNSGAHVCMPPLQVEESHGKWKRTALE